MGKLAFVFSGQGAQYPGMGKELYDLSPAARKIYDMADGIRPGTSRQCFEGTKEELSRTLNTQPCLFVTDLAAAAVLGEAGAVPDGAAGYSLGEIAALAFCKVLSYEDAFRLVIRRAEWMDECAQREKGAMLAVLKLKNEEVEELCRKAEDVYPSNYNCEGQLVASGTEEGARRLEQLVKAAGGRSMRLPVSGAFHTPLMAPAAEKLAAVLEGLRLSEPQIPLYSNVTALPYAGDLSNLIVKQVKLPVLWQKTVENMAADGYDAFVEAGPGKTLSGFIGRISPASRTAGTDGAEAFQGALRLLAEVRRA
ncbi:ACP S-malonyltransferase [Papillibacter cinnamivorans]|uniref:Malonyl CoA-acyl carrier protein transacylase n=1 Tax=Papillibacter cinnamivorans DSM 12816 TaxID=1122930 RepID=A0A1W2AHC4_9FIRM|nr:ACP S-malonyltransferase [Papillibacter cinnamivorans]SMC60077.1 [acyl-carrier-protein] S-malonyltransferase [Papillibacter cinnamivorans DSM 12816]